MVSKEMKKFLNPSLLGRLYVYLFGTKNLPNSVPDERGKSGSRIFEIPNYSESDIWYNRKDALEELAIKTPPSMITDDLVERLQNVKRQDNHPINRDLARSMIDSYESRRDFEETEPYKNMLAEKRRQSIKIKTRFGYNKEDIWYTRLDALETLAKFTTNISGKLIRDLHEIAEKENDWRISELAKQCLRSYEENGNFTETEPYKKRLAEERRRTISPKSDFGYNSRDIWYNRLDALESLTKRNAKVSSELLEDLNQIAKKEDDSRIVEVANRGLSNYMLHGNLKGAA